MSSSSSSSNNREESKKESKNETKAFYICEYALAGAGVCNPIECAKLGDRLHFTPSKKPDEKYIAGLEELLLTRVNVTEPVKITAYVIDLEEYNEVMKGQLPCTYCHRGKCNNVDKDIKRYNETKRNQNFTKENPPHKYHHIVGQVGDENICYWPLSTNQIRRLIKASKEHRFNNTVSSSETVLLLSKYFTDMKEKFDQLTDKFNKQLTVTDQLERHVSNLLLAVEDMKKQLKVIN